MIKYDENKPEMELIINGFPKALLEIGKLSTYGRKKYSRDGWRNVPNGQQRYLSAMIRHLLAHASGDIIDNETGLKHLTAVAWNALAILELSLVNENDDGSRDTTENTSKCEQNGLEIIQKQCRRCDKKRRRARKIWLGEYNKINESEFEIS